MANLGMSPSLLLRGKRVRSALVMAVLAQAGTLGITNWRRHLPIWTTTRDVGADGDVIELEVAGGVGERDGDGLAGEVPAAGLAGGALVQRLGCGSLGT